MFDFLRRRQDRVPAPTQRAHLTVSRPAIIYAIGDVHGCYDQLQLLLSRIEADAQGVAGRKLIVMLGDYVDRGPKSAAVLDWLCAAPPAGFERIALAGNHEAMMLDFLADPRPDARWLQLGGLETLRSYGIAPDRFEHARSGQRSAMLDTMIPSKHLSLLRALPSMLTVPGATFVHAGLRAGVPLAEQRDEDLLWIREPFLSAELSGPMLVIHGHTPGPEPVVAGRRICVDTGAFATGVLTAARLDDTSVSFIDSRPHAQTAGP